jgi:hypothetical protein
VEIGIAQAAAPVEFGSLHRGYCAAVEIGRVACIEATTYLCPPWRGGIEATTCVCRRGVWYCTAV